MRDVRPNDLARGDLGAGDDHRDAGGPLVHRVFPPEPVLAELLAVVGRVDDPGAVTQAGLVEGLQDESNLLVQERDHPVVGRDRSSGRGLANRLVERLLASSQVQDRVTRPVLRRPLHRQRHGVRWVAVEVLLGHDEGWMRVDERDEECPGLRRVAGLLVQPVDRFPRDGTVVAGVFGLAGPRLDDVLATHRPRRHLPAEDAVEIADALEDVHRQALIRESARVVDLAVVELADRRDRVALLGQSVPPARRFGADVGRGVVPGADRVWVASSRQAGPRRDANRRRAVAVREAGSPRRQGVQVGCLDDRIAGAAHHPPAVLVRADEEDVRRPHAHPFRPPVVSPWTRYFWTSRTNANVGKLTRVAAAIIAPQSVPSCPM